MSEAWPVFVACAPGLEGLLANEVGTLVERTVQREPGGVSLTASRDEVARINRRSGVATHVLLRVGRFPARHFSALSRRLAKLPWTELLRPGVGWTTRATCKRSKLYHSGGVVQRVDAAIADALGGRVEGGPQVPIAVRIERDECVVSIDTSGEPLHRRGWRLQPGPAPLREDLAWGLLLVSGWDRCSPLIDPMCGAGTIAIEAAAMAGGLAPGRLRTFALHHTRLGEPDGDHEHDPVRVPVPVIARDRSAAVLDAARANAERAGLAHAITFEQADLRDTPLPPATVVTHPPYGHRLEGAASARTALARRLTEAGIDRIALAAPADAPTKLEGHPLRKALMTDHGGTKIAFLVSTS